MKLSPAVAEKIIVALLSAMLGGLGTYGLKAITIEGRLDAIERAVIRIEKRLYPDTPAKPTAQRLPTST